MPKGLLQSGERAGRADMRAVRHPVTELKPEERSRYWELHRQLCLEAGNVSQPAALVWGKFLGSSPKFFIVGNEPWQQDYITGLPFSGVGQEILTQTVVALKEKYGAKHENCYVTYLVKRTYEVGEITEDMILQQWLPAIQLEYALSGCEMLVGISGMTRQLSTEMTKTPEILTNYRPSLAERLQAAWRALRM